MIKTDSEKICDLQIEVEALRNTVYRIIKPSCKIKGGRGNLCPDTQHIVRGREYVTCSAETCPLVRGKRA